MCVVNHLGVYSYRANNALIIALRHGNPELVGYLLKHGGIDIIDATGRSYGTTLLHDSSEGCQLRYSRGRRDPPPPPLQYVPILKMLLGAGADPRIAKKDGLTVL